MIKRLFILLIFSLLVLGGLFALKFYQIQQTTNQQQPPPPAVVAATQVKQLEWQHSLNTVGSLVAVSGVTVSNEIAGIVKNIHFSSGDSVKKGQLLLELDAETDKAELNALSAETRLAKIEFKRSQKLINQDFVSKSSHDQNRALLDQQNALLQSKKTLIEKKMIRAPFDGELGIRQIDLGQYLTPGSAIVTLQQIAPIYLDFQLPERQLSQIKTDQQVQIRVQAYPGQLFKGRISTISPLIDKNSRAIQIRATLSNTERQLYPGMFAEVEILSSQKNKLLSLPDTAISYNPYGNFVFVITENKQGLTVHSRQVKTGISKSGRVEIISGLKLGEQVVSAGQLKLRNGMQVTIDDKPAPSERKTDSTS